MQSNFAITEIMDTKAASPKESARDLKDAEEVSLLQFNVHEHLATLTELMKKNEGWAALVTTSSRLPIAVLLLFLVQFLIVIYR